MGELVELISENFVSMRWKVHTWDTQKQSHTSVEHSGEPRNKPTCKWSVNLQKGNNMKGEKKLHNKVIPTSSLENCEPLMISFKN